MNIIIQSSKYKDKIQKVIQNYYPDFKYQNQFIKPTIFIKEIQTIDDIQELKRLKNKYKFDLVCLIHDGEFMFELLEFQPMLFLREPNLKEDLKQLIKTLKYKNQGLDMILEFKANYQTLRFNVDNIRYFESYAHYMIIHTISGQFKVREKLSEILERLQPFGFIQIHKSYIVNEKYIQKINANEIVMDDHETLPIGKKYKNMLKEPTV